MAVETAGRRNQLPIAIQKHLEKYKYLPKLKEDVYQSGDIKNAEKMTHLRSLYKLHGTEIVDSRLIYHPDQIDYAVKLAQLRMVKKFNRNPIFKRGNETIRVTANEMKNIEMVLLSLVTGRHRKESLKGHAFKRYNNAIKLIRDSWPSGYGPAYEIPGIDNQMTYQGMQKPIFDVTPKQPRKDLKNIFLTMLNETSQGGQVYRERQKRWVGTGVACYTLAENLARRAFGADLLDLVGMTNVFNLFDMAKVEGNDPRVDQVKQQFQAKSFLPKLAKQGKLAVGDVIHYQRRPDYTDQASLNANNGNHFTTVLQVNPKVLVGDQGSRLHGPVSDITENIAKDRYVVNIYRPNQTLS